MRCTLFKAAFLLSFALCPLWVMSQTWPNKPVKLIVPFPPGGMADVVSRILGQHLSETWGQQVVVENRAGAGGTIGTSAVVKAAPDGYTLMAAFDTHAAAPYLYKINYDLLQDLTPISMVARSPMLLVANANFSAKTLPSLLQYAKDKPSAINFVTVGPGSPARLMLELLKNSTGINVTVVPYKGGGPAMVDLISGQVDAMMVAGPPPDAAVIMIGANDVTALNGIGPSARRLGAAVQRLRSTGATVVVGTCPDLGVIGAIPQPLRWTARSLGLRLARAQTAEVRAAGGVTVPLADLMAPHFQNDSEVMFSEDRYHPSAVGYALAAEQLLVALRDALED